MILKLKNMNFINIKTLFFFIFFFFTLLINNIDINKIIVSNKLPFGKIRFYAFMHIPSKNEYT